MPTHKGVITLIDSFLKEANADLEKQASNLDLAGDEKSTHPSASADDSTRPAAEGARSAENEADVKKDVPNTINDAASENKPAPQAATVQGDQGTVTMAADSGLKGNVDSPKENHTPPAGKGPGNESDVASGSHDKASAAALLMGEANALLADVALLGGVKTAQTQKPVAQQKTASDDKTVELFKQAAEKYPEDVEAGYVAAALLAQQLGLMKSAEDTAEDQTALQVAEIQKEASDDATNYVQYLEGFAEAMEKGAEMDPSMLAAMAGEGEASGMPGMEPAPEEAVEDVGGEAAPEEVVEDEGEGEGDIEALADALEEAGISPEELAEAVAAQTEGGEDEAGEGAPEVA